MKSLSKITLCLTTLLMAGTIASVSATFQYAAYLADSTKDKLSFQLTPFVYTPEEMPDVEVSAVQRLSDVLNKKYMTDDIAKVADNSLDYLINHTIQRKWGDDSSPYVGSMDEGFEEQVNELFGDVLELQNEKLKFILKSEDLNGDGKNEIAIYTTSDELNNHDDKEEGVVCVYVTVFTPVLDATGKITGYKQVCESVRGYCYEICYSSESSAASFTTDSWRTNVGYSRLLSGDKTIPEEEIQEILKNQGQEAAFNFYNTSYKPSGSWISYDTKPVGNTLSDVLEGQF